MRLAASHIQVDLFQTQLGAGAEVLGLVDVCPHLQGRQVLDAYVWAHVLTQITMEQLWVVLGWRTIEQASHYMHARHCVIL